MTYRERVADDECRYCANTGYFYSDPELGICGCPATSREQFLAAIAALTPERPKLDARILEAVDYCVAITDRWSDLRTHLEQAAALRNTHTIVTEQDDAE